MRILKFLNKINLITLLSFLIVHNSYSTEPVDIWQIDEVIKNKKNTSNIENIESENLSEDSIFQINSDKSEGIQISEEKKLFSKDVSIVGIYDPSENDLTMDMWVNSNGEKILEIINSLENIKLSNDATNILDIALLTNSYYPKRNISNEEFLKIKSDWLLKKKNLDLIEKYLVKNKDLKNSYNLIKYYVDYYLSRSDVKKSCDIFEKINTELSENYISKFKIYCLINLDKNEEAQLLLDLMQEYGFQDDFFEKKFAYMMGYDENPNEEISEKSLLDFHLSHRTNQNFIFEPKKTTSKLIWKYLSYSNLLEDVYLVDLEDQDKLSTIEMATHDKNYKEQELFNIYERYKFNINQLLRVEEAHKLLSGPESRALVYQGILITKNTPEKIKLIKILKDLFKKDEISDAFEVKLNEFLDQVVEQEVPSNYTDFYEMHKKSNLVVSKKINFNNKIIHQSKILNYFKPDANIENIEKDLENLLKKIKKDKKYFFSIKDIIMLESLKSDGVKFPKKYANIYEATDPNIPYDIQILINRGESGLALLRLAQIIGQDNIEDLGSENLYFIISVLNQLNLDKLRNTLLLKVLPLKV
tara:strand:+ start:5227 stop:6987 length:1761 start_codon:yes stop_codon:yes gene_type:complete